MLLVIVDAFSKWLEVKVTSSTMSIDWNPERTVCNRRVPFGHEPDYLLPIISTCVTSSD